MQTVFYGGTIITMSERQAEAILIEDANIIAVKDLLSIKDMTEPNAVWYDLKGKTLLPAFIDAHSHISQYAAAMDLVQLHKAQSIKDIIAFLKKDEKLGNAKSWIIGTGYDHNFLKEQRHPLREELDQVSKEQPVMITHASGHMGVFNTAALRLFDIDDTIKDPQGGKFGRDAHGKLNGYMEEAVFMQYASILHPSTDMHSLMKKAMYRYASYGITLAQEGLMKQNTLELYKQLIKEKALLFDIVGYLDIKSCASLYAQNPQLHTYQHHFRIGGYKLFLDGSPQGKTAWLSKPYEHDDQCGYPVYQDEEVETFIDQALQQDVQLLTHCNGDEAAQQLLDAFHHRVSKIRPVMIHAQTLRPDQMLQLKEIGMIPSFFIAHVYYWGDIHIQNLGMKRASLIDCANEAVKLQMPFTFHQDTPVIEPNMLETIQCAVLRKTKSDVVLGAKERISVYEALKALTIHAAYQYHEEKRRGSLEPGKLADLVILTDNPCTTDPQHIKEIQVDRTYAQGVCIYERTPS